MHTSMHACAFLLFLLLCTNAFIMHGMTGQTVSHAHSCKLYVITINSIHCTCSVGKHNNILIYHFSSADNTIWYIKLNKF